MNSEHQKIIEKVADEVKQKLEGEGTGHDWWHILRVWNNTKLILKEEEADAFVCELTALLHDIADSKFHNGDESIGPRVAGEFLKSIEVEDTCDHVHIGVYP